MIDQDEIRNTYHSGSNYLIVNPLFNDETIKKKYPNWEKVIENKSYSSNFAEKIPKEELKKIS